MPSFPDLLHEADIGSGEKTPAEHDTDAMIRSIPALPADEADDAPEDEAVQEELQRREQADSLVRDDPDEQLDALDPVPPEA